MHIISYRYKQMSLWQVFSRDIYFFKRDHVLAFDGKLYYSSEKGKCGFETKEEAILYVANTWGKDPCPIESKYTMVSVNILKIERKDGHTIWFKFEQFNAHPDTTRFLYSQDKNDNAYHIL